MKRNSGPWAYEPRNETRRSSNPGHMLGTLILGAMAVIAAVFVAWLALEMLAQVQEAATFDKAVKGW